MKRLDANSIYEFEVLKQVETSPMLTVRSLGQKLGVSVKLAHSVLSGMVERGLMHVNKIHSRRWDYYLTPQGIVEKARLTMEFLEFSKQFFHEARRQSSQLCRDLAESGVKTIAFLGADDLAEIVYLGVCEWQLELAEIYDDKKKAFLGRKVKKTSELDDCTAEIIIVCLYDHKHPKLSNYLPLGINQNHKMRWIFKSP